MYNIFYMKIEQIDKINIKVIRMQYCIYIEQNVRSNINQIYDIHVCFALGRIFHDLFSFQAFSLEERTGKSVLIDIYIYSAYHAHI